MLPDVALARSDVAIVGGGHNALVAAVLLARTGLSVTLFERRTSVGGASVSTRPFPGVAATVSPYAYLVSLFPTPLLAELGVTTELRRRLPAACVPDREGALIVDPSNAGSTRRSFEALGLDSEYDNWVTWHAMVARLAEVVAPTFLEPLRPASWFRAALGPEAWELIAERPLGSTLLEAFDSDLVRGTVLTDGLIGTFAHSQEPTLRHNRCFLYHVVGDGTGAWKVPVGGMGVLNVALVHAARQAGTEIRTGVEVVSVEADGQDAEVVTDDGTRLGASMVLCGAATAELDRLLGRPQTAPGPEGAQVKVNMVVKRLPRLRCGVDPQLAFTGTLHVNERLSQLDAAWQQAERGSIPHPLPCDVYCHSLTDPSVLGPELRSGGAHTLSLFALQTPRRLFGGDGVSASTEAELGACLDSLQSVLAEPLEDCLLRTGSGHQCVEVQTPRDLERELRLPGGNIFHGDLQWPWAEDGAEVGRWGAETDIPNVFLCGAGSRRGGGVSGLGGHNAAKAVLDHLRPPSRS